jgi:hypothetical protein
MELRSTFSSLLSRFNHHLSLKQKYPLPLRERARVRGNNQAPSPQSSPVKGEDVRNSSLHYCADQRNAPSRLIIAIIALVNLTATFAHAASLDQILLKRRPEAVIDLGTQQGINLVGGEWRYSDTKIIEVDFKAAGADGQPTGAPHKAYDFTPHAGGSDYDDSHWEVIDPTTLQNRRSAGRLAFNWYRIKITVPERIGRFDPSGSTIVFETSVDDYAEIWVDGEIPRAAGQSGASVIKGWNAVNRVVISRNVTPGQKIQLAIFGINGPISNPPTNYIYMRYAKLEFHKIRSGPFPVVPHEVNVEVIRIDPAIDAIVPPNPKIFKLAEGFRFAEKALWVNSNGTSRGHLLLNDPKLKTIYKFVPDGELSVVKNEKLFARENGVDVADQEGNRYVSGPDGIRILSAEGKHLGTIKAPKNAGSLAWGGADGKTLYITAGNTLYRMPLNIPGVRP